MTNRDFISLVQAVAITVLAIALILHILRTP